MRLAIVTLAFAISSGAQGAPAKQTIAVCSPGAAGTTADAQPTLDAFATAAAGKSGIGLAAVYDQTDEAGALRLKDAGIAVVSLPFFLKHEQELGLHARLAIVEKGRPALDRWELVAKKGRVASAAALAGFGVVTAIAFAPAFVRGPVLGGFGALPAGAKLVQSASVLSALRKAANGDPIAVVLDGTQAAALASLPFASELDIVAQSAPMPAGVVATIDARVPAKTWAALDPALRALRTDPAVAPVLDTMGIDHFEPIDDKALAAARKAYADAAK